MQFEELSTNSFNVKDCCDISSYKSINLDRKP